MINCEPLQLTHLIIFPLKAHLRQAENCMCCLLAPSSGPRIILLFIEKWPFF